RPASDHHGAVALLRADAGGLGRRLGEELGEDGGGDEPERAEPSGQRRAGAGQLDELGREGGVIESVDDGRRGPVATVREEGDQVRLRRAPRDLQTEEGEDGPRSRNGDVVDGG